MSGFICFVVGFHAIIRHCLLNHNICFSNKYVIIRSMVFQNNNCTIQIMSAQQACMKINEIQKKISALIPSIKASAKNQDEFITALLTAAQISPEDIQKMRDINRTSTTSSCTNASSVLQQNISDFTKCADAMGCVNRLDPVYKQKLIDIVGIDAANKQIAVLTNMCTFNSNQSNSYTAQQDCMQNQSIAVLAAQPFDPVIQGIVQSLTNATPIDCSTIPTSVTVETLQKTFQSCVNSSQINQSNIALCAGNSDQTNSANVLQ